MSIRVMELVWDRFPGNTTETIVLVSLADWGNDFGRHIYPSVATIAAKTRITYRHTQRILSNLRRGGWISCVAFEKGGRGHPRHYEIDVQKLRDQPSIIPSKLNPVAGADNNPSGNKDKAQNGYDQPQISPVLHLQPQVSHRVERSVGEINLDQDAGSPDIAGRSAEIAPQDLNYKGDHGDSDDENKDDKGVMLTQNNDQSQFNRVSRESVKGDSNDTRTVNNRKEDNISTNVHSLPSLYITKHIYSEETDQSQNASPSQKPIVSAASSADGAGFDNKKVKREAPKKPLSTMPYFDPPGVNPEVGVDFYNKSTKDKAAHILALLNMKSGGKYHFCNPRGAFTAGTKLVIDRMRDGYGLREFAWVINHKVDEWKQDEKTARWLTPLTLFRKQNFEVYLGQAEAAR